METEFSTDSNTNLISDSDNIDISNNITVNESINLVNNTPTSINRNNVENNQTQESPEYKLLKVNRNQSF